METRTAAYDEVIAICRAHEGAGPTGTRAVWCLRGRADGTCVVVDNACSVRGADGTYAAPVIASGATWADVLAAMPAPVRRVPAVIVAPEGVTVRPSSLRTGYVEILHPEKPAPSIIMEMKAAGFRWAIRARCWYGPIDRVPARYQGAV